MKIFVFVACLFFVGAAQAQDAAPLPKGALQIEADNALEWNQTAQTYTARGNAVAIRDELTVKGDTIIAYYDKSQKDTAETENSGTAGDIKRFVVDGHVVIVQGQGDSLSEARGDHVDYNLAKRNAVMTGKDLKLTTPDYIVTARDSMEYNEATQTATARGDAAAVKDGKRLAADVLNATFTKDAGGKTVLNTIKGQGKTSVTTPDEIILGDRGTYDAKTDIAIMDGNVKITRGDNQLNGDRAEINNKTGISRLLATGKSAEGTATGGPKKRVRALIVPKK